LKINIGKRRNVKVEKEEFNGVEMGHSKEYLDAKVALERIRELFY
jgi:hypothetical protein